MQMYTRGKYKQQTQTCIICGREFTAKNGSKYCKRACKEKARYARLKAKKKD